MVKLMKRLHKQEKGFTLVELMVVVVIIGVLVAIAIPIMATVTANAEARACQANQRTIDGAVMMWYAEDSINTGGPGLAALTEFLIDADALECPTGGSGYDPGDLSEGEITVCPDGEDNHDR